MSVNPLALPEGARWEPTLRSGSGVPYSLLWDEGIVEDVTEEGPVATVKFRCLWSDRYVFARDLVGAPVRVTGGPITYLLPARYPPSPNLYCRPALRITPFGKGRVAGTSIAIAGIVAGWPYWTFADVTATFALPLWPYDNSDPSGRPWTETSISNGGEALTVPESTYHFSSDGSPITAPIGIVIPQLTVNLKRHWMPYLPLEEMAALTGKVNSATVVIGDKSFDPGYLLFIPGDSDRKADSSGNPVWDQDYKFVYRGVGWNNFLHPDGTSGFVSIVDGNDDGPYLPGDLNTLP